MSENKHFEIKVPGGKLVIADITTDGSTITDARISGDFFLEPDAAYEALTSALVGAGVHEDTDQLTQRLDAALSTIEPAAELHGFTTRDVAVVTRRAVTGATDFTDHRFEVIHSPVLPTPMNVALDEVLTRQVAAGERGPTLRLWEWEDNAVVIGSFQSYVNEIDDDGVRKHDMTVVRRISGGGAMFMEGGNCVTYSLYVPESMTRGLSYADSYQYLDDWVLAALKAQGVNAWYVPLNDITSDSGKIGGAAQKRNGNAVLHHVTMSYDIDADKMAEVLRVGKVKLASKGLRSAKKRVDPLRRQIGAPREDVIAGLIDTFCSRYDTQLSSLTESDLAAAEELVEQKFGREEWTKRVR
ncbi:lipoate--protein ligase [Corynebacterium yudongzhengii]|uniref:Lipoate--protein ligase n=1 Tax=Corynebacterium yudongzhengii TaxID=2080740 RepID=A0A2U1T3X8_9CORY|nr:biotin/lipoate A/B protein ligase family protein [Corynebacterium yudongzhengii]AWB82181.1 lipoate--protein ligase [Corynebacterium yudongzhengii]PWC00716.1 lipoate--protein ligase [Corynebacterium yudongzhengii]